VTEILKQRLVGLLLVVIAGVMFLPDILDGKKELTKEEFKKIPPKPAVEESPYLSDFPTEEVIAKVNENRSLAEDKPLETETIQELNNTESEVSVLPESKEVNLVNNSSVGSQVAEDIPKPKSTFSAKAWVIQLGSFKQKENAEALMEKLKAGGFITFSKPVETRAGILSKVFVGPEIEKSILESKQPDLKSLTGLDGKITPYDPIN
jgi:DedD protein